MLGASYHVARLTRARRIRCRPELLIRTRSTSTFDNSPWAQAIAHRKRVGSNKTEGDALEERPATYARQKVERQDYELAKSLQRTARRRKSTGENDGRPRKTLPSLKDRRSFLRASPPKATADPTHSTSAGLTADPTSSSSASSSVSTGSSSREASRSGGAPSSATFAVGDESATARQSQPSRKGKEKAIEDDGLRRNPAGVQLLSPELHKQLFPGPSFTKPPERLVELSREHLALNGLNADGAAKLQPVNIDLPPLRGSNIREHFHAIGRQEAEPYLSMAHEFARTTLPPMPEYWAMDCPGWVKYLPDGSYEPVTHLGDDDVVVFDVEVLYKISPYPVIATAASATAWYSWLCPTILEDPCTNPQLPREKWEHNITSDPYLPHDLIPLFKGSKERLVIGHNVGYDRARIKDEYGLTPTSIRFLDTLSLHVATRGITSVQRPAWMKRRKDKEYISSEKMRIREATIEILREVNPEWAEALESEENRLQDEEDAAPLPINTDDEDGRPGSRWEDHTSMNSLKEVSALYCGTKMDKSMRDWFADESITHASQLRNDLQDLIQYCADDVKVTHDVYRKVFPLFIDSCPHPASFAGALNMGSAILPVDDEWGKYIKTAETMYRNMGEDVKTSLRSLAEKLRLEGPTPDDPWHSQLDWTPKRARWVETGDNAPSAAREAREAAIALIKKSGGVFTPPNDANSLTGPTTTEPDTQQEPEAEANEENSVEGEQSQSQDQPRWYSILNQPDLKLAPGVANVALPLLLQVTYNGLPVVHLKKHAWCFVTPAQGGSAVAVQAKGEPVTPEEEDAEVVKDLAKENRIFRIGNGKAKKAKLLAKSSRSLLSKGLIASPYSELLKRAVEGETEEVEAITLDVPSLASALLDAKNVDLFTSQLAHLFQPTKPKKSRSAKNTSIDDNLGTWPTWYHELTKPANLLPPGQLDLTQKKSVTPLLLRLQWEGHPLVISKTHKWLFKVPTTVAEERGWTKEGSVIGLGEPVTWNTCSKDGVELLSEDTEHFYFKLPHPGGEGKNVGSPLTKSFVRALESGQLSSANTGDDSVTAEVAATSTKMNVLCSYWASARERIMEQMVVYDKSSNQGYILPKVIAMGTVTRRAVESTWLTASNAKKNRLGSELKSMVKAPHGYALVGADVDSEELWISSVMGDSQFGIHGATAIGWMTLEGTKAAGTDLHSKTASILGTSRDAAKIFNYSRIYGAGVKHAVQLLMQGDPTLTKEAATDKARALYAATKGAKSVRDKQSSPAAMPSLWHGGTESFLFNTLEMIALSERPTTPALGCGVTRALSRTYLEANNTYLPSRVNWVVQSSGVDYLHLLIVSMSYLIRRYGIKARYLISVHDEVRYMVKEEDKYRAALALQIANAWTRALFCYNLGMDDAPQGVTFFSAVDIDHVLRKEVNMTCVTPSHPDEIPPGESLDIGQLMAITSSLGPTTSYDVDPSYIPTEATKPPVTLFPNIHSSSHYRFLQAQAERQAARAKWWLDSQRPLMDPSTGEESMSPAKRTFGRTKGARLDRMRTFTSHLGEKPEPMEIREALAAFEAESQRGWGNSV